MIEKGFNLRAAGDLSQYALVKQNSTNPETDVIATAAITDIPIAVALQDVDVSEDGPRFQYVELEIGKVYTLIASATIAAGAQVGCAASGKAVTAASTEAYWFLAVQAATADQVFQARYTGYNVVA